MKQNHTIREIIHELEARVRSNRRWRVVATCLASVVVFTTVYLLVLPAITIQTSDDLSGAGIELTSVEDSQGSVTNSGAQPLAEGDVTSGDVTSGDVPADDTSSATQPGSDGGASTGDGGTTGDSATADDGTQNGDANSGSEGLADTAPSSGGTTSSEGASSTPSSSEVAPSAPAQSNSIDALSNDGAALGDIPETHVDGGTFMGPENNELTWEITINDADEYTLTVSGNGPMPDFANSNEKPWYNYRSSTIKKLVVDEGITRIGTYNFDRMTITDISFGSTVAAIGSRSFEYGWGLDDRVEIPGTVQLIENSAFVYHYGMTGVTLNEGTTTIEGGAFGTSKIWTKSTIDIPASVSSLSSTAFSRVAAFNVDPSNQVYSSDDEGLLYSKDGAQLLKYPNYKEGDEFVVPAHVTRIEQEALKSVAYYKSVRIPSTVDTLVYDAFRGCSSLEEIYIEDGVNINVNSLFVYMCPNLVSIRLPEDQPLNFGGTFCNNNALTLLTIPKSTSNVGNLTYGDTAISKSLVTFIYDAQSATITANPIDSGQTPFDLVIGRNVDVLPANFAGIALFNSSITFQGPNELTIEEGAFATCEEPLASLTGKVYVDEHGILYSVDEESNTATLVNIPATVRDATIPASIELDGGVTCSVTGVAQGAAKHAERLRSIVFADPSLITFIDIRAFANCPTLREINGKTTVQDIEQLFNNAGDIPSDAFYNTGLTDAPGQGGFGMNMDGSESLVIAGGEYDDLNITLSSSGETLTWMPNNSDENSTGGYRLLTGDTLSVTASVGNEQAKSGTYRIYLKLDGEDGSLPDTIPGESYEVDGIKVSSYATSDPYTVYVEFTNEISKTLSIPITALYPSPSSPGGGITIWGARVDAPTTPDGDGLGELIEQPTDSSQIIQAYWTTEPDDFELTKENSNANNTVSITGDGEGGADITKNLSWTINLTREEDVSSYGKDYVRSADFTDIITLPEGVSWNATILDAIKSGDASARGSAIYVDGEPIISIGGSGVTARSVSYDEEAERVEVTWRFTNNTASAEIAPPEMTLDIYPAALDIAVSEFEAATDGHVITNTASATLHYTYSDDKGPDNNDKLKSSATMTIGESDASLRLTKTGTDVRYFGEDIDYTITLENAGAGTFTANEAGSYTVRDSLNGSNNHTYIKPDNIEKMFVEAEEANTPLQVNIDHAELQTWVPTTDVNGEDGNTYRTPTNSPVDEGNTDKSLKITYDAVGSQYKVSVAGGSEYSAGTVAEALQKAGFSHTETCAYTCIWTLNEPESNLTLAGGASFEFHVYATVRDTFEVVGADWPGEYPDDNTLSVSNVAQVYDQTGKAINGLRADSPTEQVHREVSIGKAVYRDGDLLASRPSFSDKDVLDYHLYITHYGEGSIDNLPMVDDLYGNQYLMVPVENNPGLEDDSLKTVRVDNADYYLLKEGNYSNVVVGSDDEGNIYTADKITVAKSEEDGSVTVPGGDGESSTQTYRGLHTQIKWYYDSLPAGSYVLDVTYKAYVDSTITEDPAFDIGNMVWLNDKPGKRLYDGLWGSGSIIEFDKFILEGGKKENPDDEIELEESGISEGETITYRLDLHNTEGGSYTLAAADVFDALPETYGVFKWTKDNVRLSYKMNGIVNVPENFDAAWAIEDDDSIGLAESETQQYLRWQEGTIRFDANATLYIYIELTYPKNDSNGEAVWDNYVDRANGAPILNTLWLYRFSSSVTHELEETGSAFLQKGVYALYTGNTAGPNSSPLDTRDLYTNQSTNNKYIRYYVLIMNTGNKRLYLNDLYDRLPEGFTYFNMQPRGSGGSSTSIITTQGGPNQGSTFSNSPLVNLEYVEGGDTEDIVFKSASITERTDDSGQLHFSFGEGAGSYAVSLDQDAGKYYLDKNEAIVFGYTCAIGRYQDTEDEATNTIAMPYEDYLGTSMTVTNSEFSDVEVASGGVSLSNGALQNDGNLGMSEVDELPGGIAPDSEHKDYQTWLSSVVTVNRGVVTPGVTKHVDSYTPLEGTETPYEGSVHPTDVVNWELTLYNTQSTSQVMDYEVVDTLPYPYTFTGPITLTTYDENGSPLQNGARSLLTIAEHDPTSETVQVTSGDPYNQRVVDVTVNGSDWLQIGSTYGIYVKISRDEQGNETLHLRVHNTEIPLTTTPLPIEANATASITYSSVNKTDQRNSGAYMNEVVYKPVATLGESVTQGNPYEEPEGTLVGAENSAPLNVSNGYSTSSDKRVVELDDQGGETDNDAAGMSGTNTIRLASSESKFNYTLSVTNSGDSAVERLVLIDTLPEPGDTSPFDPTAERGSAFKVSLDSENVKVVVRDGEKATELTNGQFTVEYSTEKEFTDEDWASSAKAGWNASYSEARAIRITLNDTAADGGSPLIPAGARVDVTFAARVDGEADPSSVAWNSFGYSYKPVDIEASMSALSMPVGVRVPSAPRIVKQVVDRNGRPTTVQEDSAFTFYVYEGEPLGQVYGTEQELVTALKDRAYSRFELNVSAEDEDGRSDVLALTPRTLSGTDPDAGNSWIWETGKKYNIVEVDPGENFTFMNYAASPTNAGTYANGTFTFTYSPDVQFTVTATNQYDVWSIAVNKVDGNNANTMLPGAVFALYSRNQDDAMNEDEIPSDIDVDTQIKVTGPSGREYTVYLKELGTTDENGQIRWTGLTESFYYVLEIKAPAGFAMPDNPGQFVIRSNANDGVATVTVENFGSFELPSTGGPGTTLFTLGGVALMGAACIAGYRKRSRKGDGSCC